MAEEPTPFSALLAGYGTTSIGEGVRAESVFALLKLRAENGSTAWSIRNGGVPLAGEELLGVLDGLTTSMRQRLTMAWKNQTPAAHLARRCRPCSSASSWRASTRSAWATST